MNFSQVCLDKPNQQKCNNIQSLAPAAPSRFERTQDDSRLPPSMSYAMHPIPIVLCIPCPAVDWANMRPSSRCCRGATEQMVRTLMAIRISTMLRCSGWTRCSTLYWKEGRDKMLATVPENAQYIGLPSLPMS
eukprot:s1789_g8.t1